MIKTAITLAGIAVGTGFLSAITGTFLNFTGRGELEPLANMIFAGVLLLVAMYAFFMGISVIDAHCFAPFGEQLPWIRGLKW